MHISGILLAAGMSRRLGRAKQLLMLNGKSFLEIALEKMYEASVDSLILVLGAREQSIRMHLSKGSFKPTIVSNSEWDQGMSKSLKRGLEAIPEESEAVLVWICDQPLVSSSHLQELIHIYSEHQQITASGYNDGLGVPAVFPKSYFDELQTLKGQKGAKYFLRKYREETHVLPCPEAAFDVDTEEDYRRIVKMN